MKILRGIVHDGKVTLSADSQLEEGTPVLIVVDAPADAAASSPSLEEALSVSAAQSLHQPARLMDLQGLGREIWQGEEAGTYLNRLRDDWG